MCVSWRSALHVDLLWLRKSDRTSIVSRPRIAGHVRPSTPEPIHHTVLARTLHWLREACVEVGNWVALLWCTRGDAEEKEISCRGSVAMVQIFFPKLSKQGKTNNVRQIQFGRKSQAIPPSGTSDHRQEGIFAQIKNAKRNNMIWSLWKGSFQKRTGIVRQMPRDVGRAMRRGPPPLLPFSPSPLLPLSPFPSLFPLSLPSPSSSLLPPSLFSELKRHLHGSDCSCLSGHQVTGRAFNSNLFRRGVCVLGINTLLFDNQEMCQPFPNFFGT